MGEVQGREETTMTCAEFQRVLPYIIESGGNPEEAGHLKSCAQCADLVRDLKYIAEQAKLLLPLRDPSPAVWAGIHESLEREGLLRPSGNVVRLRPAALTSRPWNWTAMAAAAAVVIVGFILLFNHTVSVPQQSAETPAPATVAQSADDADAQVVRAVAERNPDLRATYESSLRDVNDYIHSAQQTLQQNPDDAEAHEHLMQAYEQKAMLYDMALSRSAQ